MIYAGWVCWCDDQPVRGKKHLRKKNKLHSLNCRNNIKWTPFPHLPVTAEGLLMKVEKLGKKLSLGRRQEVVGGPFKISSNSHYPTLI